MRSHFIVGNKRALKGKHSNKKKLLGLARAKGLRVLNVDGAGGDSLVVGQVGEGKNVLGANDSVVSVAVDLANNDLGIVLVGHNGNVLLAQVGNAVETHVRHVDGGLGASEDEQVVKETTKAGTDTGSDNGDPEVVSAVGPDAGAVAQNGRGKTGAKVTSRVDGIASLPAEGGTEAKDEEEEGKRTKVSGSQVVVVVDGVDTHHEDGRGNDFRKDHTGAGHEGGRVGAEDASGGSRQSDGSDTMSLVKVKGRLVVSVDDKGAEEGTHELGKGVDGELLPGESAEDAVGQRDGGVEMAAGDATRAVDTEHDTDTPAPGDGLVGTLLARGEDDLGDDTVTEEDDHHGANELGEGLAEHVPNARPQGDLSTLGWVDKGAGH